MSKKDNDWEEVGGMTDNIWDYKEMEEGSEFVGVFKRTKEGLGENNSKLHIFEGQDNKEWGIWGCHVLNDRFSSLFSGEEVKVLYLGKVSPEDKNGRPYHNFQVFKKKYTEEQKSAYEAKKESVSPEEVPF